MAKTLITCHILYSDRDTDVMLPSLFNQWFEAKYSDVQYSVLVLD
jgi:hypothetical protein